MLLPQVLLVSIVSDLKSITANHLYYRSFLYDVFVCLSIYFMRHFQLLRLYIAE